MNECLGVSGSLEKGDPVESDDHPVVGRGRIEVAGLVEGGAGAAVPAGVEDRPREGDVEPDGVVESGAANEEVQVHGGRGCKSRYV